MTQNSSRAADALVYALWLEKEPQATVEGVPLAWSMDVAALLLAGLDPNLASAEWPDAGSPDADHARATRIRDLLIRAFRSGDLKSPDLPDAPPPTDGGAGLPRGLMIASPEAYMAWAKRSGIALPEAWARLGETDKTRAARLLQRRDELKAAGVSDCRKVLLAENPGLSAANLGRLLGKGGGDKPATRSPPPGPFRYK